MEFKIKNRIEDLQDLLGNFNLDKVTKDCLNNEIDFLKSIITKHTEVLTDFAEYLDMESDAIEGMLYTKIVEKYLKINNR